MIRLLSTTNTAPVSPPRPALPPSRPPARPAYYLLIKYRYNNCVGMWVITAAEEHLSTVASLPAASNMANTTMNDPIHTDATSNYLSSNP
ncbi:unnamed protein product, partial [Brenthis ino]